MANDATAGGNDGDVKEAVESQSETLKVIAVFLVLGAAWVLAAILVPFMVALVSAIALSPLADRLERGGFPRALASLACTLAVALLISLAVGLILYQAGTIAQDSDKYIQGFGNKIDLLVKRTHSARAATTLGLLSQDKPRTRGGETEKAEAGRGSKDTAGPSEGRKDGQDREVKGEGEEFLHRLSRAAGGWLVTGFGGILGILGAGVLYLAYLFYMLEGRDKWVKSLSTAGRRIGLKPAPRTLEEVRHQVVMYVGCLSMIALAYAVVVSLILWLIKVPQPILWGVLAGMLEVVPYFGPLIASVMPTIVALSLGSWWQPIAVLGMFLTLHLIEGYLIEPKLYGRAVRLDPVTILFGAIFFGGLWGPAGLAIATPMMIILRGLIMITPDTPALDALAGVKEEKAPVAKPVAAGQGA